MPAIPPLEGEGRRSEIQGQPWLQIKFGASLGYSISLPNIFSLQRVKTAKRKREQEYEASVRTLAKNSRLKRFNMKRQGDEEKINSYACICQ